jgi:histidinol-phosphate/aromatic aminotransferase/cobyric acid decarboxylase-like protein
VHQEHILVGNGAAELIKCLMEKITGKTGFIRPTFEEYPNRYMEQESVIYIPENENLAYGADDLMKYFEDKEIQTLVLVNPDNPSGNYIPKADVLRLADWCQERKMRFIVDESFVDFADEADSTMIDEEILLAHKNLIVMKSISKSYGVPGIRLGILASSDECLIAEMKKEVAIWNINSYGEFYLQIAEKYKKDYAQALEKIRQVRKEYVKQLEQLDGVRVLPSQANYVCVELTGVKTAKEVTKQLLHKYQILIKDLSGKIRMGDRQFVRLAVRTSEDNMRLVEALKEVL